MPVALLALVIWWRQRESSATTEVSATGGSNAATTTRRRTYLAPLSLTITRLVAVLAVVIAGGAVYDTYRIGDSGAKASWNGRFSPTPAQDGPGRPDGD